MPRTFVCVRSHHTREPFPIGRTRERRYDSGIYAGNWLDIFGNDCLLSVSASSSIEIIVWQAELHSNHRQVSDGDKTKVALLFKSHGRGTMMHSQN